MERYFSVLQHCPLFSGLDEQELTQALAHLSPALRRLERGEFLLHADQRVNHLGVVLEGCLHILREDAFGGRAILADIQPGDLFAEAYACAGAPLEVEVTAQTDSAVLLVSLARLRSVPGQEGARLTDNLIRVLARKNLTLNEKIGHLTRPTTREKLLSYLAAQRRRQGSDSFTIPFDRQQLADYLSVDRSAMSTQLSRLRREGLISCSGRRFTLHMPENEGMEGALQTGENKLK